MTNSTLIAALRDAFTDYLARAKREEAQFGAIDLAGVAMKVFTAKAALELSASEGVTEPAADYAELVKGLLAEAKSHSDFTKSAQTARMMEYVARGDKDADYRGIEPEETIYWRAASAITKLSVRGAATTKCFECGGDLSAPVCAACNPLQVSPTSPQVTDAKVEWAAKAIFASQNRKRVWDDAFEVDKTIARSLARAALIAAFQPSTDAAVSVGESELREALRISRDVLLFRHEFSGCAPTDVQHAVTLADAALGYGPRQFSEQLDDMPPEVKAIAIRMMAALRFLEAYPRKTGPHTGASMLKFCAEELETALSTLRALQAKKEGGT